MNNENPEDLDEFCTVYESFGVAADYNTASESFMPGIIFPAEDDLGNPVWDIKYTSVASAKIFLREFQKVIDEAEKMNKPENLKKYLDDKSEYD